MGRYCYRIEEIEDLLPENRTGQWMLFALSEAAGEFAYFIATPCIRNLKINLPIEGWQDLL